MRQPDIARAESELDWSPRMDVREGLAATFEDFRVRRAAAETGAAETV